MIELELGRVQGRARVWFHNLPDWACPWSGVIERTLPATRIDGQGIRSAAVELFIHTGGICPYGLLAGEFVPQDSNLLLLQTIVSSEEGTRFDALVGEAIDEVRFGLPLEYAEGVLDGASAARANCILGSGTLRFGCAVHGKVGSSANHFRRLARLVVELLRLDTPAVTEKEVACLLESRD